MAITLSLKIRADIQKQLDAISKYDKFTVSFDVNRKMSLLFCKDGKLIIAHSGNLHPGALYEVHSDGSFKIELGN